MDTCFNLAPLVGAFADGETSPEQALEVRRHLQDCTNCRKSLKSLSRLNLMVGTSTPPAAPSDLRARIVKRLDRADRFKRVSRKMRWGLVSATVAASALLLILPRFASAEIPELVRLSSSFHTLYLKGNIRTDVGSAPDELRTYFKKHAGAEIVTPKLCGTDTVGGCCCNLTKKEAFPWILYRRGDVSISLIVVPDDDSPMPARARRTLRDCDYHVFTHDSNTVIVCRGNRICHIWIARIPEKQFVDLIMMTQEGQDAFSGQRLTIAGITCQACCALAESTAKTVAGVEDARIDMQSMELILRGDGKIDLGQIIRSLQNAGFDAKEK